MADVAAIKQYPDESTEDYLARFKAMRSKCRQDIEETVAVQLALNGMTIQLRGAVSNAIDYSIVVLGTGGSFLV